MSWWKCAILLGAALFVLFYFVVELTFPVLFFYHSSGVVRKYYFSDDVSPSEATRVINEDPSFSDRSKFVNWIPQAKIYNTFASLKGFSEMRSKREIPREKLDCGVRSKNCEELLRLLYSYNKFTHFLQEKSGDILKCLQCKILEESTTAKTFEGSFAPSTLHQPNHLEENKARNSAPESGSSIDINLLDNTETNDNSRYFSDDDDGRPNRMETAKNHTAKENPITYDAPRDVANGLPRGTNENTATTDGTGSYGGNVRAYVNYTDSDKSSNGSSTASDSRLTKLQSNETNVTVAPSKSDKRLLIDESKVAESTTVTSEFIAGKPSAVTTTHNVISEYGAGSDGIVTTTDSIRSDDETRTRKPSIDFAKRTVITDSVTSQPTGPYVTGNNDDGGPLHPSVGSSKHPSFEGHREKQNAVANGARSRGGFSPFGGNVMSANQFTKDDKFVDNPGVTAESMKGSQQLQMTPAMSWTMPHPVCFYGYPGQLFNKQFSSGSALYPAASGAAFPQNRQPSAFQDLPRFSSSPTNYVQVQAQSVQFMPRFSYAGSLERVQPTEPAVGPTGPALSNIPIFSLNQQQNSGADASSSSGPYFCTYISVPTLQFPSISGTSQLSRSSSEKPKDSHSGEPSESHNKMNWMDKWPYDSAYSSECPPNFHQCFGDGNCISKEKRCDGQADCADASDEISCSCKNRISRDRLCDGYFDCPHGEDEIGCFDCPEDSFSCEDWDLWQSRNNCLPFAQRCDGVVQCHNGKDELNCNILTASAVSRNDIFPIGYIQGYLHKNIRGQWYPVCSGDLTWMTDACTSETGQPVTTMPQIEMIELPDNFLRGPYLNVSDGQIQLVPSCSNLAVYVRCSPFTCGSRFPSRQNTAAANNGYARRRHAEGTLALGFDYQEILRLLHVAGKEQTGDNDTFVGSQVRVVGGRASRPTDWPFVVAIYKDGSFHCGGVIVDEICVITAAHCMHGYETHYYEVYAGMLRRFSFSPTTQSRGVKKVMIHPNFEIVTMQNDIATVMLDEPLLFNRWVRQICLPAASTAGFEWERGPTVQSTCVATGWGAMREYGPDPDHLQEVAVPILSSCKHIFDRFGSTICAGYPQGGYDACQGDSGGPLMCRNPNMESQWYLAGVISHGEGCGRPDEPGAYTKLSHFVQWIQQSIKELPLLAAEDAPLASCPGFSCRGEHGVKCLPIDTRCNRVVDCLGAEDEIGCPSQVFGSYGQYKYSDLEMTTKLTSEPSRDTTENQASIKVNFDEAQTRTDLNDTVDDGNDIYKIINSTDAMTPRSSVKTMFSCVSVMQTITIDKRCDGNWDCNDGTDEVDCTCRDYLSNVRPALICDGHLDCDDGTDEENCDVCKENEFHCVRSRGCVPTKAKCDLEYDCPLHEDEADCFALTDGERINVDSENRPALNREGLLGRYVDGIWRTQCVHPVISDYDDLPSEIGKRICEYLGFAYLELVKETIVNHTKLEMKFSRRDEGAEREPTLNSAVTSEEDAVTQCSTLWVRCRPVLSGSADSYLIGEPKTGNNDYLWPWLAAIFVDGHYRCAALLLEPNWLLSSSRCTEDIRLVVNYTTALLGQSRAYLHVDGPHQQISVVDKIVNLTDSHLSLLHLKTAVNVTRHALPLFLEKKIYPPEPSDLCVAIGTDEKYVTRSIFLRPVIEDCDKCQRCFVESSQTECPSDATSSDWSGTIACRGEHGWYPAAVFHETNGLCSFRSTRKLTSIDYLLAYIMQVLDQRSQPTPEPTCDGVRCGVGQCVPWNRMCDGITNCRDSADETYDACENARRMYDNADGRKCRKSELRCVKGECLPKSTFCDAKVDCSDGTDEPVNCTCGDYLRLTAPERLCDGVRHCFDKTDEAPEVCQCAESSFKCSTESEDPACIPQDFVCDGNRDCPNGEDEEQCEKTADGSDAGEVLRRSHGVWHTQCFSTPATSEDARAACKRMGFASGDIDRPNRTLSEPTVPSYDNFYIIRLNAYTWIKMRDDRPFVNLVQPEDPCYRLSVRCTARAVEERK